MGELRSGDLIWQPDEAGASTTAMARFMRDVSGVHGLADPSYNEVWSWSVNNPERFWPHLAQFFDVRSTGSWSPARSRTDLSGAGWFPAIQLNYTDNVFSKPRTGPALLVCHEAGEVEAIDWDDLRSQVAAVAHRLRSWGVVPGDRVAAYLPNASEAVVAFLATAAVGAVWSCCAPDYGVDAVVDRLSQIAPRVLLVTEGYYYGGRRVGRQAEAAEILSRLPSVENAIWVGNSTPPFAAHRWDDLLTEHHELVTTPVPFDHPLWILYSSGTTGLPKGIVHSHGGIVLEHLKWWGLHNDVRPGDRFFWFTSTAWMVWNASVSTLLAGATVVLYDGSPSWPNPDGLWDLAGRTRATHVGTSAGYLVACQQRGAEPGQVHDLTALRCVMSSGSLLPITGWAWVYDHVKADVWLDTPSGGTDVCTPYVGGNPLAAVHAGEMQCRFLGTRVEAWNDNGDPVVDDVGELVVTAAMPSMPVELWNDPGAERLRETYFDYFPGVWRHGDWITITARGTARIHGRSDSTINRHGIRIGSADIYAVVEQFPEIADSLLIGAELGAEDYWMPLFVTLTDAASLDDDLRDRIRAAIRTSCSARHVPDEIVEVPAIPRTLTGKRIEVPIKRLIQGVPVDRALNAGVIDRPDVLGHFIRLGEQRRSLRTRA